MFAGDIHAPRQVRIVDVPEPQLDRSRPDGQPGEIIFQPELACLCGSDVPYFQRNYAEHLPKIGQSLHEMIGTVVDSSDESIRTGDRVLCIPFEHFGFFQRYCVPASRAIVLDPRLTDIEGVLSQPLGTVIHALKKLPSVIGLDVAVVGQGPMGQLFTAALRNLGARQVIALDKVSERLEMSRRMGATAAVDANQADLLQQVEQLTGGRLADLVIEAVGHHEQALNLCTDLCRTGGRILFFGVPPETIDQVAWRNLFWKNITVHTSVNPDFPDDFALAMQWIAERRIDVAPLATHRFAMDQVQQAFDLFTDRRDGAIKVFLEYPPSA